MNSLEALHAWMRGIADEMVTILDANAAYAGVDLSGPDMAKVRRLSVNVATAAVASTLERLVDAGLVTAPEVVDLAVVEQGGAS